MKKSIFVCSLIASMILAGCASKNPYMNEQSMNPVVSSKGISITMQPVKKTLYVKSKAPANPKLDCYAVDVEYSQTVVYKSNDATNKFLNAHVKDIKSIPCSMAKGPIQ